MKQQTKLKVVVVINLLSLLFFLMLLRANTFNFFQPLDTIVDFIPRWLCFIPLLLFLFLCRRLKYLFVGGVFVLLNFIVVMDLQLALFHLSKDEASVKKSLNIMAFNTGINKAASAATFNLFDNNHVDILLMQEASAPILKEAKPEGAFVHCIHALCVASRVELEYIDGVDRRTFDGWGQIATVYRYQYHGERVYIANVHLQTPRHALSYLLGNPSERWRGGVAMLKQRELESWYISAFLSQYTPLIIAGDFNFTQQSPLYRRYWSSYSNSFDEAGTGLGYTKETKLLGVRIDHILYSDDFAAFDSRVLSDSKSDHFPIMTQLEFSN